MKILEMSNGMREGFAPLDNIGYFTFEVNLEGEVYTYAIHNKAERVGNRWKIYTRNRSGNPIERVMRTDVLVGCAWYNINESLWQNSTYADTIRRCKEFFSIPNGDIRKTDYQTSNGFYYYVTKEGEVWNTETMTKVKGGVNSNGYRHVTLGSRYYVAIHRLVAHHFVSVPKYLLDQRLSKETLVVNHLDCDKLNNRSDNLEWTTQKSNIDDHLREHIWQRLEEGYSDTDIGKETGIPVSTVSAIRKGRLPRYRTDKYTWSKHSPNVRVLDKATVFNIYDEFTYTDNNNAELSRKYNVHYQFIYDLRRGRRHSNLAREYITSKGLDRYWKGYRHPK